MFEFIWNAANNENLALSYYTMSGTLTVRYEMVDRPQINDTIVLSDDNVYGRSVVFPENGSYKVRVHNEKCWLMFPEKKAAKSSLVSVLDWGFNTYLMMNFMFCGQPKFDILAKDGPITPNMTSTQHMFRNCTDFNSELINWDAGNIKRMDGMFSGATKFNKPLTTFKTGNVISMRRFLYRCSTFDQDLSHFDTGKVENMTRLFCGAANFNKSLQNWDVSKVKSFNRTFAWSEAYNQPMGHWDTGSAVNMDGMFLNATSFNQDLNSWDVSNVKSMRCMFKGAKNFDRKNIESWDLGGKDTDGMFG